MNSRVAKRMRNGTIRSNMAVGVQRRRIAPINPPTRLGAIIARKCASDERISRRYPNALPTVPGQMATVLVALAVTESSPSQIRAGNETSVPPPATELMAPATKAAPNATPARGKARIGFKLAA
jgi:hypothetical protein